VTDAPDLLHVKIFGHQRLVSRGARTQRNIDNKEENY
jgi:hypothetical protein